MERVSLNQYASNRIINTQIIQNAVDEAATRNIQLVIEEGLYKIGTLFLRSNSNIHLEKGAVLCGSTDIADYPDTPASFVDAVGGIRGKTLILAYECANIKISGEGEICGNGGFFNQKHQAYAVRPFLFRIVSSEQVSVSGISMTQSAAWCLHINESNHIDIDGIKIKNRVNENNDGIDIDSSSYVSVANCHIDSGDDAICLKTTTNNPCMYIDIQNCRVTSGWSGFKIGTESVGDIAHVRVKNCFFYDVVGCGIKIVPVDGANVFDIQLLNNRIENSTGPIFIALGERLRKYAGCGRNTFSTMKNIVIDGLEAEAVRAPERGVFFGGIWGNGIGGVIVSGTKNNYIENLVLRNMDLSLPGGEKEIPNAGDVPEMDDKYPEFHIFDPTPAKGIYIRSVRNLELKNINMRFLEEDARDLLCYDNVDRINVLNVR